MKVIVAGTRTITTYTEVVKAIEDSGFDVKEIVSGVCIGPDELAIDWAVHRGLPYAEFPAKWSLHGKRAGPLRNQQMVDYADALVAVWDGNSPGTADIIRRANGKGIPVYIHTPSVLTP